MRQANNSSVNERLSRAKTCLQSGDAPGAEAAFRDVLAIDPQNFEANARLGQLLIDLNRAHAARPLLTAAANARPDDAGAAFMAGRSCALSGDFSKAAEWFEAARVLADNNPGVLAGLIDALERAGRLEEAKLAADSAVDEFPADVEIVVLAARVARRLGDIDTAIRRLEAISPGAGRPADQASRFHELALIRDKTGDYDGAFSLFTRANECFAEVYRRRRIPEGLLQQQIAEMAAYVGNATPALLAPVDGDVDGWTGGYGVPHFVVGFLRSGTTLVHQMLDARGDVHVLDERPMALRVRGFIAGREGGYPEALATLDPAGAAEARASYETGLANNLKPYGIEPGNGLQMIDKFPLNLLRVPMIHRMSRQCRFVFVLRDPLDVCLSCFMQAFQPSAATRAFLDMAETARVYAAMMIYWIDFTVKAEVPIHTIRYETLISDFEPSARALCDFLNLSWDPEMMRFDEHARRRGSVSNPSYHQVARPVYSNAVERWRCYETNLAEIREILADVRGQLGYD